jgi:hypothetical protein
VRKLVPRRRPLRLLLKRLPSEESKRLKIMPSNLLLRLLNKKPNLNPTERRDLLRKQPLVRLRMLLLKQKRRLRKKMPFKKMRPRIRKK